jgi:putative ABC transport system permease protein
MLKNYFLTAFRVFWRKKGFSIINILGLSIGISAALVIYLIVHYDFSFDKFEKNNDRIYRVVTDLKFAGTPLYFSGVPDPLGEATRSDVSGIEITAAFHEFNGDANVAVKRSEGEKPQIFKNQDYIVFADSNYFKLIPYEWAAGSPAKALSEPFKVVLSEDRAKAYFPSVRIADIIGKQIVYNDSIIVTVTGVVKDLNENSDFEYKEFLSQSTIPNSGLKSMYAWTEWSSINSASQLFLRLSPNVAPAGIESQLKKLLAKYSKSSNKDDKNTTVFLLQPLSDLHFNEKYDTIGDRLAHKPTLYGLLTVAAFLLLLGCINFINLTTAQAAQRAKEIGIRKTMGSSRRQLLFQFLNETFIITIIATLVSIVLTPLLLKVFGDFIPKNVNFHLLSQPNIILFLLGLVIVVTCLSGFYPALVLSKFKPVLVLKNQAFSGSGGSQKAFLRKTLTVSQFFIAQAFIMATIISVKQINYMLEKDMGFRKDAILFFSAPLNFNMLHGPDSKRNILLDELKLNPGIDKVSLGQSAPSSTSWNMSTMTFKDGKKDIETEVRLKMGDTNYLKIYNIQLLAGRNIQQSDTIKEYIINETYLHVLGFQRPQDILNKNINGRPVVGVMADFNQQSLHDLVKPLAFASQEKYSNTYHILLKPEDAGATLWKKTIDQMKSSFKKIYPEEEFNYQFFDQSIAKFYKSEQDQSRLLKWATGLAVFISCMGLLGLVIYTTNQRTKEIGVRKVLGASITDIVNLLSRDFILLVAIAFVIATPLTWIAMRQWLQNFAYRTTMNWWVFLASGLFMILIALITLSIQTIKSAIANPVKSLRTEG